MMKDNQLVIIEPGRTSKNYIKDLWVFRELFIILSWRDVKVRYKQTTLGILWVILRPFLTMVIFTLVFEKIAGMKSEGSAPYSIMVFAALLPWQFFSNAFSTASESLISNSNLLTKVYFPRLIVPASSVITSLIDFLISFIIMGLLMWYYHFSLSWHIIFLPIFIFIVFLQSFGFGLYLAALNVKYRDFRYVVPFIVQLGLYISPVGFSSNIIPEKYILFYYLNPIVSMIDGFRWCIIGTSVANPFNNYFLLSLSVTIFMVWYSILTFRKLEKSFADII